MPVDLDNFLDPVPQALCCPVCQDVAWPPVIACENQHVLCEQCLMNVFDAPPNGHLDEPPACPTCRAVADDEFETCVVGKRILEGLRYRCARHAAGREWTGSVADESNHRDYSRDYRELSCFSCGKKSFAKDGVSHTSTCPNGLVACPNGDNDTCDKICRSSIEQHMTVCTRFRGVDRPTSS
ncbi:TRAF-like zinc finger [Rhodotorula toruloides]|uniref:TRAF-like zinc finger n=1 Tax=Rhodotorula toruloides TaxID=5286 RepID=A0A511KNQ3_RHOTO|nr:TRAF-like zinc finger [Rhodotorula toruloides]